MGAVRADVSGRPRGDGDRVGIGGCMNRRDFLGATAAAVTLPFSTLADERGPQRGSRAGGPERHLLYIAEPGIRNYVRYGGGGGLVYDIDTGYKFLRRLPPSDVQAGPNTR